MTSDPAPPGVPVTDPATDPTEGRVTDVVLEGGGVKGLGLAGALLAMGEAGWRFARVGGTSAGAVVGAVLAALVQAGEPVGRLEDVARSLDYRRFRDRGFPGRYLGPLGAAGRRRLGAGRGRCLRGRLPAPLAHRGAGRPRGAHLRRPAHRRRRGRRHHPAPLPAGGHRQRRLPRRLVQLPWHYGDYGLDPDEQRVVDAVRASASIPFFFEPVTLRGPAAPRPWWTAGWCRTTRSRCSTAPTAGPRAGRRSGCGWTRSGSTRRRGRARPRDGAAGGRPGRDRHRGLPGRARARPLQPRPQHRGAQRRLGRGLRPHRGPARHPGRGGAQAASASSTGGTTTAG